MNKNNTQYPSLKELEQMLWRNLQETFSTVMTAILKGYDQQIAQERDSKTLR